MDFKAFLLYIFIFCLLSSCSSVDPYEGDYIDLSFNERLVFGSPDSMSKASLLSVAGVQVGDQGKVFVAESSVSRVKVFSPQGEFLYQFGRRGRGPGEFTNIKNITLADSLIYVWDEGTQRMMVFTKSGDLQSSTTLSIATQATLHKLGDQNLLLYLGLERQNLASRLVHIYGEKFAHPVSHVMPIKDVNVGIEEVSPTMKVLPGYVHVKNQNTFYFVPKIFVEHIYEYSRSSEGAWEQEVHKGMNRQDPFTVIEQGAARNPDASLSSIYRNEPLRIVIHNNSRGILEYNNLIFHFTFVDIRDRRVFGVEVYDHNLDPIGYSAIRSIPITEKEHNHIQWFARDVDKNGNFYIKEQYRDGSRIRVLNINDKDLQMLAK